MIKRVFAAVLAACLAPHAAVPVRVAVIHTREASLLQLEFEVRRIASLLQVEEIVLSQCNKSSSDVRCAIQVNYGYRSAPIPGDTASVPPDWIQTLDTLRVPGGNPERLVILPTQIDVGGPAGTAHFDEKDVALVRNWYPHMPLCGYPPCPPGDSAGIRKNLVSRLQRTGVAYRFVPNDSSLGFGPWRRATGKEPLGLLTTPFPSNAGSGTGCGSGRRISPSRFWQAGTTTFRSECPTRQVWWSTPTIVQYLQVQSLSLVARPRAGKTWRRLATRPF